MDSSFREPMHSVVSFRAGEGTSISSIRGGSFLERTMVLIPALNEEGVVASTIREWLNLGVHTVRVVDNGSTDRTRMEAKEAGAQVCAEPRRGYGAACWTGLQQIPDGVEWILFSSADGSDRLATSELDVWQQAVDQGHELLLGNRCLFPGAVASLKPLQRFGSWLTSGLLRVGWNVQFSDMASRRAIQVQAFRRLKLRDRAFGWNIEMQIRAVEEGLRFLELPVPYYPRRAGRSKISGTWLGSMRASYGILSTLGLLLLTKPLRLKKRAAD